MPLSGPESGRHALKASKMEDNPCTDTMTPQEYVLAMDERTLQDAVTDLAERAGYLVFHDEDSRRNRPGFPDFVAVHPVWGVVYAELKTETGRLRPMQREWVRVLRLAKQQVFVWRPHHWRDGTIARALHVEGDDDGAE